MSAEDNNADLTRSSAPKGPAAKLPETLPARNLEVGDEVARGGMGAVLYAKDLNIGRDVAIKVVLHGGDASPENLIRFVEEAQVTGQLEHPGIVPIYDLGTDENGQPFYTMKLVKGVTLKEVLSGIAAGKAVVIARYPLVALLTIFQKVCDAVAFAHSKSVIHRDLKPENVMIGEFGEVLVMDWGLAKRLGKSEAASGRAGEVANLGLTMAGTIMGSPQFMAPEQAEGRVEMIDARTDVFALGGMLYNILALQAPFDGATADEVLAKVRRGEIQPVPDTAVLPHLPGGKAPESLAAVTLKAMAKARINRYQSVKELQADIAAYQGGYATTAEQAGLWRQLVLLVNRNKFATVAATVIVTLTVGFTIKVVREGRRAENALVRLRTTAPNFFDQSRTFTERQQFAEALDKIDTAIALNDTRAEFHAQRGNILQLLMRFDEAGASYRRARARNPRQPFAADNCALSEKLAHALKKDGQLSRELLAEFYAACGRQERIGEALVLGSQLQASIENQLPLWRARMRRWLGVDKLALRNDGFLNLTLSKLPVTDIEALRGMPIKALQLNGTKVRDLSPLAGMPLEELQAEDIDLADLTVLRGLPLKSLSIKGNPRLEDIRPLTGMALEKLHIESCAVSDLSPLRGMPLRELFMGYVATDLTPLAGMPLERLVVSPLVRDLTPLRGMPLKLLNLYRNRLLTDIQVLADCPTLEGVVLPMKPGDIEFLRKMPRLQRLSRSTRSDGLTPLTTAEDFWKEYDAQNKTAPR